MCFNPIQDEPNDIVNAVGSAIARSVVAEATVLWRQRYRDEAEETWVRYLAWIHRVPLGDMAGHKGPQLVWLYSTQDKLRVGARYFLPVDCTDSVLYGVVYRVTAGGDVYWRVGIAGRLRPVEWLANKTQYEAATRPAELDERLRPYALPRTRWQMRRYLKALDGVYERPVSYTTNFDGFNRVAYLKNNTLRQAVNFSHVIVRARVVEYHDAYMEGYPASATIEMSTEGPLRGVMPRQRVTISLFPGQVEAGKEYLFLLRGDHRYEKDPQAYRSIFDLAARNHAVIPIENTRKAARVYRMLGLEMPEE